MLSIIGTQVPLKLGPARGRRVVLLLRQRSDLKTKAGLISRLERLRIHTASAHVFLVDLKALASCVFASSDLDEI